MRDLTQHLTTRADDNHAPPVTSVPSASAAAPGADRGLPGMWRTPCGPCFRCCANVPTGRSSDRRLKICGVLCDDMTVAPVATATSNLKHLRELV